MSDYRKPTFKVITPDGKEQKVKTKIKFMKASENQNKDTIHIPIMKIVAIALLLMFSIGFIKEKDSSFLNDSLSSTKENVESVETKEISSTEETLVSLEDNVSATINMIAYANNTTYTSSGLIWGVNKDSELVILTAKHCVEFDSNAYYEIYFVDGSFYQVDAIYTSDDKDFAFLTIDLKKISSNTINTIKTIKYDYDVEYKNGNDVYVLGKHSTKGLLYYTGQISSPDFLNELGKLDKSLHTLHTNFSVVNGTSGGGIFNEQGLLLGICSTGSETNTIFVPIYDIIDSYTNCF